MKVNTSTDKYDVMAEINMIPFIDVALVLLIIFMVMTPFLVKEQIKINLPKTQSTNTPVDNSLKPVQINVTSAGAFYVNGEEVTEEQLYATVKQCLTDAETQPVVIAADKDVAFEKVVLAMDAAKRCGAKHLGVSAMQDANGAVKDAPAPAPKPAAQKSAGKASAVGTPKAPAAKQPAAKRASGASGRTKTKK